MCDSVVEPSGDRGLDSVVRVLDLQVEWSRAWDAIYIVLQRGIHHGEASFQDLKVVDVRIDDEERMFTAIGVHDVVMK